MKMVYNPTTGRDEPMGDGAYQMFDEAMKRQTMSEMNQLSPELRQKLIDQLTEDYLKAEDAEILRQSTPGKGNNTFKILLNKDWMTSDDILNPKNNKINDK